MKIIAKTKSVKISPRKMRLVAGLIKNKSVEKAFEALAGTQKRASLVIEKTLKSALANALNNAKLEKDNLIIDKVEVNEGTVLKRYHPSTRGRIHPYKKRSSHITIVLKEKGEMN